MQTRLTHALDTRFDDLDEIKDVANYGCGGGVSGFIYTTRHENSSMNTKKKLSMNSMKFMEMISSMKLPRFLQSLTLRSIKTIAFG